ncbi:MAG: hypothetical protein GX141_07865 [Armatimonadetes bacterium]|nr:hypothetical protein [Armatimonadota bacterium]
MMRLINNNWKMIGKPAFIGLVISISVIVGLAVWAARPTAKEHVLANYSTSLRGRSQAQIHNLNLAINQIDGYILYPGKTFSFVEVVGPWTADMGYQKAPVSYDGELIRDWGGGVCQASSTLYNAALLAGLKIEERHRHHWPAKYAPVGRDAAVAYSSVDLKFTNTTPAPIRIAGEIKGDTISFCLLSKHEPTYRVWVESQVVSIIKPGEVILSGSADHGRLKLLNKGQPGFHVVTYRCFEHPGKTRREIVSDDTYPAMNKVVQVVER